MPEETAENNTFSQLESKENNPPIPKSLAESRALYLDLNPGKPVQDIDEIIANGSLEGRKLVGYGDKLRRWKEYQDISQREQLLHLYAANPEFAHQIVSGDVAAVHGSSSGSLLGVLEHGLRPQKYLREQQIPVSTGEGVMGSAELQEYVSVFPWHLNDRVRNYSVYRGPITSESIHRGINQLQEEVDKGDQVRFIPSYKNTINNLETTLSFLERNDKSPEELLHAEMIKQNFPVLYFINLDEVSQEDVDLTRMDDETIIKDGVSPDSIKVIAVPSQYVEQVRSIIKEKGKNISVFSIEEYQYSLYKERDRRLQTQDRYKLQGLRRRLSSFLTTRSKKITS